MSIMSKFYLFGNSGSVLVRKIDDEFLTIHQMHNSR